MHYLLAAVVALILSALLLTDLWRYTKTGYLIVHTSPYEQSGNGASVLVLGDSTGYGTGVYHSKDSIAGRMGTEFPDLHIENNSVNGRTIGELKEVVATLEGRWDLILLQIGGNDILQGREVALVEAELTEIFGQLFDHAEHIVMMSSGDVGGAAAFSQEKAAALTARTLAFREMFLRVSAEYGVRYVDLYEPPERDLFQREPETYLAIDGLHPSAAGYGVWYEKLSPIVEEILHK